MRKFCSSTILRTALGGVVFAPLLALIFAVSARAQTSPAELPLSRAGQQERGTRWVANPFDIEDEGILAAGREILCNPWPGEETAGGSSGSTTGSQPQDCLLYQDQRVQPEARQWYQKNLPFLFYQVPGSAQGFALSGPGGGSTGLARGQQGRVLQSATTGGSAGGQQDDWLSIVWGEGTGENKGGAFGTFARLVGAYNAAAASNVTSFAQLASWGDSFLPAVSETAGTLVPGAEIRNALAEIGYGGRSRIDALALRPAAQDAYAGNPNENLSKSRPGPPQDPEAQAQVCGPGQPCGAEGNQFFAASRLGENVGGIWATPFNGLLGQGAFGNIFSGMFGNMLGSVQGLISQFGSPDLARFFSRFPIQTFSGLANRFGIDRLSSLFGQDVGTGAGGDGARLDRPPRIQALATEAGCPSPSLTPSAVADIADVLGLPRSAEPWAVQFQQLATLGTISGTNPETGQQVTVGPASLPGETCTWTVRAGNEIVIASDRPDGGQVRLIP